MTPRTVPQLIAAAHGIVCEGPHRCFYCGAPCDGSRSAEEHVKASFTGRDGVFAPGSPAVCEGCVLCLRDEATIDLIDGTSRHMPRIAMRSWSWVVTSDRALAASKAHLAALRRVLLAPPEPPWAVVLSDSGQKQLLYRGAVNRGGDASDVTLETERIRYRPAALAGRVALCTRLVAATGKPALAAPVDHRFAAAVMARYADGEALVDEWCRVAPEPLSRLAAWPSAYSEVEVDYGDLHARNLPHQDLDRETDRRWYAAIREMGRDCGGRHVLGLRAGESSGRRMRCRVWGHNSPNGCAPLAWWSIADVFAALAAWALPVHPAYAMLGAGRWPRDRLRVAEIGDTHGTGGGRREWEAEYYGDALRRIEAHR